MLSNDTIIHMLSGQVVESPESLLYKSIFPYFFIPSQNNDYKTCLMLTVDTRLPQQGNTSYCDLYITIWITAHIEDMQISNSQNAKTDVLGQLIIEQFCGEKKYGVRDLCLVSSKDSAFYTGIPYRKLVFLSKSLNWPVNL